jgi:hypothetical protein
MPWEETQQTKAACKAARARLPFDSIQPGFSRPFRPRGGSVCYLTQGIGLRPQKPWAGISRPLGPVLSGRSRERLVWPPHGGHQPSWRPRTAHSRTSRSPALRGAELSGARPPAEAAVRPGQRIDF